MRPRDVIGNTSLMMLIGLVIALAVGSFPASLPVSNGTIAMLTLIVMMTLSLSTIELKNVRFRPFSKEIMTSFLLTFVVSSGFTFLGVLFFSGDTRIGWVLEAAVPSAVSVISFTYLWGGRTESSVVSSLAIYIMALAVTPFLTLLFLGEAVSELTLLYYVGVLIIIPMALSPFVRRLAISAPLRKAIINIAFLILVIAIAGGSRAVLLSGSMLILALALFSIFRIFTPGLLYYWLVVLKSEDRAKAIPGSLFITYKNTGMAASLALVLAGPEAAVPAAICIVVEITWLIIAGRYLFPGSMSASTSA